MPSDRFSFGTKTANDGNEALQLPSPVAKELVLASVFGLVQLTSRYPTVSIHISHRCLKQKRSGYRQENWCIELSELLWLGDGQKGAYTMLVPPARAVLRTVGHDRDEEPTITGNHKAPPGAVASSHSN